MQAGLRVVLHHSRQLGVVADHQEARRHRADQQILGGNHLGLSLPDAGINCQAAQVDLPGSQVIRQHNGDLRPPVCIGEHLGVPVSGVLEVLADDQRAGEIAAAPA